ncbi:hypothetical protein X777_10078 [Ooceraea biroi]|uniref:THAP-type domain-containing protein n=1 Tax=Ooceraea biroi TaxID=2015173 RepID=A0A026X2W3_OOCBI|nr:hypothetical protein X777_10078 [Ooceraea biroi]
MPQCAVASCRNSHRRTRAEAVRYHRFPRHSEVRERWVRACGRTPNTNGDPPFNISTARICSSHFEDEYYEKDGPSGAKRSRLKPGAVPTRHVPTPVQPFVEMMSASEEKRLQVAQKSGQPKTKPMAPRRRNSQKVNLAQASERVDRGNMNGDSNVDEHSNSGLSVGSSNGGNSGISDNVVPRMSGKRGNSGYGSLSSVRNSAIPSTSKQADELDRLQQQRKSDVTSMARSISKKDFMAALKLIPTKEPEE